MINPYCKSLRGLFAQLAFYGVIKEEDAQCMKTDITVESYFYILFVGCLLLAIINTMVMTAVTQYFRDVDARNIAHSMGTDNETSVNSTPNPDDSTVNDDESIYTRNEKEKLETQRRTESIHPTPIMFTDRFRWLLNREDRSVIPIQRKSDDVVV
jgi:hypothetical protein